MAYRENGLEAKNISFLTYQKVPIEPEEDKSVTGKPETKEEAQQPQQETPGERGTSGRNGKRSGNAHA